MSKSEINNEFILLRHAVRQARVCTINKLIKEAKLLRDRHGNEAQREKCRKKADKLIDEVFALKTIKDDEISKFGIFDERSLSEILQDPSSSTGVRIMARVIHYKTLNKRLIQFKERFPDCKKYLAETDKKTKSTKLRDKSAAKTRKSERNTVQNKSSKRQKVDKKVEQSSCNQDDKECNKELSEVRSSSRKRKKISNDENSSSLEEQKLIKLEKDSTTDITVTDRQSNIMKQSSVTKEATVKRFTELLEEQETNEITQTSAENQNSSGTTTEQVNMVDDFFITKDDQNYQSNASTSYTRSPRRSTRTKTFQTNDRINKQSGNRKNDMNFRKEHPGKQFSSVKSKKNISNRMNKSINKSNANENVIVNKKDENSSNLHPSWMAKKKEQEIMSQGFQGKKIVFTDD